MTEPPAAKRAKTSNSILAGLLASGAYSDYTIECGEDVYRVHRNVLSNFDFFATACEQKFKEGTEQKIVLDDDDRDATKALIQWMYTQDYSSNPRFSNKFDLHVNIYIISQKYAEPQLQELAKRKFAELVESNTSWANTLFMTAVHKLYTQGGVVENGFALKIAETCIKNQPVLFEGNEKHNAVNERHLNDCHGLVLTMARYAYEKRMSVFVSCPSCGIQLEIKILNYGRQNLKCNKCPYYSLWTNWLPAA